MGSPSENQPRAPSHVVLTYRDEEEDRTVEPYSSLLPSASSAPQVRTSRSRSCCKRLILIAALLTICIGVFELAFHGKEADTLHAAEEKIHQLQQDIGDRLKQASTKIKSVIVPHTLDKVDSREPSSESSTAEVKRKSVIVLKTGTSVLLDRLPLQLLHAEGSIHPQIRSTGESNYTGPQFSVYSDAAMQVGPFRIHDALANVSSFVRNQTEFSEQYSRLHKIISDGDLRASKFKDGWKLDKWKFFYMWQDAYRRNPHADWYIGYEDDVFVMWESLFRFLGTRDANKEDLYGCPMILVRNQELFANGGCPYVISGALMRATFGKDPHFAEKYDTEVAASCCGDGELSNALRKSGSKEIKQLADAGRRFQMEKPREILFNKDNWCEPIINFHHVKSEDVQFLSQMERTIRASKPNNATVLYSDIFDHLVPPQLSHALQNLTLGANTTEKIELDNPQSHTSSPKFELNPMQEDWEAFSSSDQGATQARRSEDVDECKKQCINSKGCTTWFWLKATETDRDGDCYLLHDAIKIGKSYEGTGLRTSGWIGKRVASFKAHHYCKNPPSA